jgi:hypothetical protein
MTELQHQIAVIKWSKQPAIRSKWPALKLLFHIPNERKCSEVTGKLLRLSGVKRGVPDLFLPVARGEYHGLFIEMKTEKGKTTPDQDWWITELSEQGYFAEVCHGWESAKRVIEWYMELKQ